MDPPEQSAVFDNPSPRDWARWNRALALFAPNGAMRIIQARTNARVTTTAHEALNVGAPVARVTTVAFNTLNAGDAHGRVTTLAFEALVSIRPPPFLPSNTNPTLRPAARWLKALALDLPPPLVLNPPPAPPALYLPNNVLDVPVVRDRARWQKALAFDPPLSALLQIDRTTMVRVTTLAFEAFNVGAPNARVSTVAFEAFDVGNPYARMTTAAFDVLNAGDAHARVTTLAFEVLLPLTVAEMDVFILW